MIIFYHDWLKQNEDVVGKKAAYIEPIDGGVELELYTGPAHGRVDGWITAVVAVHTKKYIYRFKYEGGAMQADGLEGMAKDCIRYIKGGWSLKEWQADAEREYKRQIPLWRRIINL